MSMKYKIIGLVAGVALVGAMVASASAFTGAYFSDTKAGTVGGNVGSIKVVAGVNADGGGGLDFSFTNILPGNPNAGTVYYTNSGLNNEDVYIVFPNADALKALNNQGTWGSASIVDAAGGVNWVSNNLTDYYPSGTPGNPGVATLFHVPSQMLIQSNVAPGAGGSVTFTYPLASKTTGHQGEGWNLYPIATETHNGFTYTPSGTVGANNGLPYQIVAVQVGQDPGMLVHPPLKDAGGFAPSWY